jgi:hypothetical protein
MGLDTVEFVIELEKEFGVVIPDEEASVITTVGELALLIVRLLRVQGRRMATDEVIRKMTEILHDRYRVPRESVLWDARIVKDLGLE